MWTGRPGYGPPPTTGSRYSTAYGARRRTTGWNYCAPSAKMWAGGPADRIAAEPAAVKEIIARCAHLPLALAAARAAIRPHGGLRVLAEELRDTRQRWQTLTAMTH